MAAGYFVFVALLRIVVNTADARFSFQRHGKSFEHAGIGDFIIPASRAAWEINALLLHTLSTTMTVPLLSSFAHWQSP